MMRGLGRDVAVTEMIMGGSALGDAAALVALVLRVHEDGGSTWAVTALLLAGNLPAVFSARPAGVMVDRYDSRVLMVGCALLQTVVCLPLAVSSSIGVMVALVAGLTGLATVADPARTALVPDMVGPQHLLRANAVLRGATATGRMMGWSLGGFLTGMLGSGSVLLLDAVSFAVLAAGAMVIRTRRVPGPASGPRPRGGVRVWVDGTVDPVLTLVAASVGLVLLFVSCTNVAQVFFVKDVLGASDTGYGVVGACWMIGMVLAVPLVALGRCTCGALATMVVAGEAVTDFAVHGAVMINQARLGTGSTGLPGPVRLADALVHEGTHTRCNAAQLVRPFLRPAGGDGERVMTPLRADPRPLAGLFQQLVVLVRSAWLYRRLPAGGDTSAVAHRARQDKLIDQAHQGAETLTRHREVLTDHGQEVLAAATALLERELTGAC